jgi:hypothetical protein
MSVYKQTILALALTHALLTAAAPVAAAPVSLAGLPLSEQADKMPAEFRNHFFNAPLAARIELDGVYLGDAMLQLSREERIQLLRFTDIGDSPLQPELRERWRAQLGQGIALGRCDAECGELRESHFDLTSATLFLITGQDHRLNTNNGFHAAASGTGALISQRANLVHSADGNVSGTYYLDLRGSLGSWTALASAQLDRSGVEGSEMNRYVQNLYAQREMAGQFARVGYFMPDSSGLIRQPRTRGSRNDAVLGVMFGSSDTLRVSRGGASLYPIYVTANRPGLAEIYRDGVLIHTQPLQAGLHPLDTAPLPGGIYAVEVRVVEDGQVTTTSNEMVYKPSRWSNPDQRWRYNAYAGQTRNLWRNPNDDRDDSTAAGIMVNYLLHPRAMAGLSVQHTEGESYLGASLDWELSAVASMYGNLYHSADGGSGSDAQLLLHGKRGSVVLGYSDTWRVPTVYDRDPVQRQRSFSASGNLRLNPSTYLTARVSHSQNDTSGTSYDLGFNRRLTLMGTHSQLRLGAFNRPLTTATGSETRDRGVEMGLTMALGRDRGTSVSGSLGSRTSVTGGRDLYGTVDVQHRFEEDAAIRSVQGGVTADSHGVAFSGGALFDGRYLHGDIYGQQSTRQSGMTAGLNLGSTLVLGSKGGVLTGETAAPFAEAGMIVELQSDMPNLRLQAYDSQGSGATLRPGRNFVPVTAYKPGSVQLGFAGDNDAGAVIDRPVVGYQLNRGGVAYAQVKVMQTMTVFGRLVDGQGQPLSGVEVANHAGRTFSEPNGYFSLELSSRTPTLAISRGDTALCQLQVVPEDGSTPDQPVLVGDLRCDGQELPLSQTKPIKRLGAG